MKRDRREGSRYKKKIANEEKSKAASDFDALFQIASNIRAHTLLTMRNCRPEEWTPAQLQHYVSLFSFLNSRHTWNHDLLSMSEPELFEVRRCLLPELTSQLRSLCRG